MGFNKKCNNAEGGECRTNSTPLNESNGDASKTFPFQFGSISPGVMNGVAIPPRTTQAPSPNIEDQAHQNSFRSVPLGPKSPVPKQQQPPRKQSNAVSVTGLSMPMPYHQSQASLQFGGPNPHIQSQGISTASLQMPMPMPIPIPFGNAAQVQQQVFVPGLGSHPMHHAGMMHQMNLTAPIGHHQLGMGIGIGPQYPRKTSTVKITHPETHQELRLDKKTDAYSDGGTSGVRSHPTTNMPSQSQPIQSLAASHPTNYYSSGDTTEKKTYSTDFLLKFSDQCTELPQGFEISADFAEAIRSVHAFEHDSHPNPRRNVDMSGGISRMDRRGNGMIEDNRWNKVSGNFGVLRNPRPHIPLQYANFQQRGLIPSRTTPQTPLQMMHKAEKKYEVGQIPDAEQAKQRQLKAILNKLTPQNFERLFEQVKAVNIDNAVTLTGVISQIFEKALTEPTFCEMYANFCSHLASELPDLSEDNQKITFKRLLLNKCQEEFEKGEKEQEEANKADEESEERRVKARRRMLGNIRLIGELYKKRMLTERIMHECINKLLGQYQDPDEEDIEALCKLMSTIGEMIDHPKAKTHIDAYFQRMNVLSDNMNLSSRVRFMLKDSIDLRKNKWQERRKVEGPKKIDEVHRDAVQERQAQAGRTGRGQINNPSARRNPMDFGPRGSSMLSSPTTQMGGLRGQPTQVRGYGSQGARTLPVPLPQRTLADNSLTLGPQGGLARGMSNRGYDQSNVYDRNNNYANKDSRNGDRNLGGPILISPNTQLHDSTVHDVPSEKAWPEERLQDMSMAAIREYYSARDEKEVALCIKDLNSPNFHPSMISLWVIDSFERKDTERDVLAKLLTNLVKSQDRTLSQANLVKGFESVLNTLEDAVNDAPRAAEFLGRIFARVVTESIVTLNEIGQLIHDGGEEAGSLLEAGLAADVLGWTLETIQLEKGEDVLAEFLQTSNLLLETFRPPNPITSRKLDKFI